MVAADASRNSSVTGQATAKPTGPVRRRWFTRLLTVLLVCGLIVWFAPTIIGSTSLRNSLPGLLLKGYAGSIDIGEASLGWLSPVELKKLRLTDDAGQPMLEVDQLVSSSSLLMLLTSQSSDLGTFKISRPVLRASLDAHDSNVERFVGWLANQFPSSDKPAPAILIEIENARLELNHTPSKCQAVIEPVSCRVGVGREGLDEFNLLIGENPDLPGKEGGTDWVAARFGRPPAGTVAQPNGGDVVTPQAQRGADPAAEKTAAFRAAGWKLERLKPLLLRMMPASDLAGELTASSEIAIGHTKNAFDWDWNGTIAFDNLNVAVHEALLRDKLQLQQVKISGRAATTNRRLALHDVKVATDAGDFSATGDFSLDVCTKKSVQELLQALLSDEDYHLRGQVDLKKLASLLPQTLRIRDGIEITAGEIRTEFVGVDVNGQRRWSGTSEIAGLTALNQGQQISWDHPIAARVNAHRDQASLVIDMVECRSDFLQILGKGTLDDARFSASGDLARLAQNLNRFVDLGLDQLSGQLKANGEIKRSDAEHVSLTSNIVLDDFAYVVPQEGAWREKHLDLSVAATGETDTRPMLIKIDTCELHLKSAADTLDIVLDQSVELQSSVFSCAAHAQLNGGLTSWQNRLRSFVDVNQWRLMGSISVATRLVADATRLSVDQLKAELRDFVAETPGWQIKEESFTLEGSAGWDKAARKLTSPKLTLHGKSLSLELGDLDCSFGPQGLSRLTGAATYRADLVQLSSWRNQAIPNPSNYLIGTLSGSANITQQDKQLTGKVEVQVEKLVLAGLGTGPNGQPAWVAVWKEPKLRVACEGAYDQSIDVLTCESGQVEVDGFSIGAKGTLRDCSTNQRIDLSGQLIYDWDALINRFGPQTAQEIQISGKDQRPFSLKGSLAGLRNQSATSTTAANADQSSPAPTALTDLIGQAGLGWSSANLYGIKVGSGEITAQIEKGICQFKPIDLSVNGGKLHATPVIYLDRNPFALSLPQEKLLDQVNLTRDLCANWIKFVAPMLADSAQVEGKISIETQQALVPLGMVNGAVGSGVLIVHGAQARPGALAMQIAQSINQIRSIVTGQGPGNAGFDQVWVEMPEHQVPVKFEQGRMYHEGLTFIIANVTVKTSGSVGLDNSLNMVAQIPLKDDLLGRKSGVAGLKGKTIQIPITGTTSRPQIDPRIFADLARDLGGSMLDDLLQDKAGGLDKVINNGLDRLLKGKK